MICSVAICCVLYKLDCIVLLFTHSHFNWLGHIIYSVFLAITWYNVVPFALHAIHSVSVVYTYYTAVHITRKHTSESLMHILLLFYDVGISKHDACFYYDTYNKQNIHTNKGGKWLTWA